MSDNNICVYVIYVRLPSARLFPDITRRCVYIKGGETEGAKVYPRLSTALLLFKKVIKAVWMILLSAGIGMSDS